MDEIGFGIVGCGIICNQHVDAVNEAPGARIAGFCDVDVGKAKDYAKAFDVPHYSNLDAMLENDRVHAVCLCTPSSLHADLAIAAARAGRHVFTEKPMAVTLEDIDAMIDACKKANVKLGVVFQRRAIPKFALIKKVIEAGEIGTPILGSAYMKYFRSQDYYDSGDWRGTWRYDGGGCLMNQGIHLIDLLLWFMGPAKSVRGKIATLARKMETEDVAAAAVEFESGALGVVEGTTAAYPLDIPHRLEIHGDRGSIMIKGEKISRWQIMNENGMPVDRLQTAGPDEKESLDLEEGWNDGHRVLVADMANAIREDRDPLISGEEGKKAVELILAIYQSSKEGKPVELGR
jgi:predicted dehydrogenase